MAKTNEVFFLPLAYHDKEGKGYCDALMPSQCRYNSDARGLFMCSNGELVKVEWRAVFRNEHDCCRNDLEVRSQNLYSWSFSRVRSTWIARLGSSFVDDGCWDVIRMVKVK